MAYYFGVHKSRSKTIFMHKNKVAENTSANGKSLKIILIDALDNSQRIVYLPISRISIGEPNNKELCRITIPNWICEKNKIDHCKFVGAFWGKNGIQENDIKNLRQWEKDE